MTTDPNDLIGIQEALHAVEQDAQRGPRIVSDAYAAYRDADRTHEQARARAHQKAKANTGAGKPTVADIEAEVCLNTITERESLDRADIAHRYAVSRVKEMESRRSSLQTRAKLITEQMRLVGTGRTP
jgi:hypothetical protein